MAVAGPQSMSRDRGAMGDGLSVLYRFGPCRLTRFG